MKKIAFIFTLDAFIVLSFTVRFKIHLELIFWYRIRKENAMATHSSILAMGRGAWQATVHGMARVGHDLVTKPPPPPR